MSQYSQYGRVTKVIVETYYFEPTQVSIPFKSSYTLPKKNKKKYHSMNPKTNPPRTKYNEYQQVDYCRPPGFVSKFKNQTAIPESPFQSNLDPIERIDGTFHRSLGSSFVREFDRVLNLNQSDISTYFLHSFEDNRSIIYDSD